MATGKKIAVIGCGPSGLSSIKHCKEEGLEPTCFEQHEQIGGTWWYTDEPREDQGAPSYKNLVTNTSKYTTCFTDYPPSEDVKEFMPHYDFLKYQKDYAKHFDLYRHIKFNTRVLNVKPTDDFDTTGCWEVFYRDGSTGDEKMEVFHGVMLCTGMFVHAITPDIPGRERFNGISMLFSEYRRPEVFTKKRVLIIGSRFSGGDAAAEASYCAEQVYLSVGEGSWIFPRLAAAGLPNELKTNRDETWRLLQDPYKFGEHLIEDCMLALDHKKHGMGNGKNPAVDGYFMMTDDLPYRLVSGKVKTTPRVTGITETGAVFSDGSTLDVDMIVFAVGYESDYNYVDCKDVKGKTSMDYNLYKWCVPISLSRPTLFVVNGVPALGPTPPIMELNSRWGVQILAGKCKVPSKKQMQDFMATEKKFYNDHCLGRPMVWTLWHMHEVAVEFGCATPSFWRLMLTAPSLAMKVYYGPALPQHYRITGPGSTPIAVQQIHKINDRFHTMEPFKEIIKKVVVYVALVPPAIGAAVYYYLTYMKS